MSETDMPGVQMDSAPERAELAKKIAMLLRYGIDKPRELQSSDGYFSLSELFEFWGLQQQISYDEMISVLKEHQYKERAGPPRWLLDPPEIPLRIRAVEKRKIGKGKDGKGKDGKGKDGKGKDGKGKDGKGKDGKGKDGKGKDGKRKDRMVKQAGNFDFDAGRGAKDEMWTTDTSTTDIWQPFASPPTFNAMDARTEVNRDTWNTDSRWKTESMAGVTGTCSELESTQSFPKHGRENTWSRNEGPWTHNWRNEANQGCEESFGSQSKFQHRGATWNQPHGESNGSRFSKTLREDIENVNGPDAGGPVGDKWMRDSYGQDAAIYTRPTAAVAYASDAPWRKGPYVAEGAVDPRCAPMDFSRTPLAAREPIGFTDSDIAPELREGLASLAVKGKGKGREAKGSLDRA